MAVNATATIETILTTATNLFLHRGYRAVSINDIVSAAGITKPTLYYHFADKEALYVQMGRHMLRDLHTRMDAALVGKTGTAAQLTALADVLLSRIEGDTRLMRREMTEHLSEDARAQLAQAFEEHLFGPVHAVLLQAAARGELRGYPSPLLAFHFLGIIEATLEPNSRQRAQRGLNAAQLVDLFLHGAHRQREEGEPQS